jgi:hypothetical protein
VAVAKLIDRPISPNSPRKRDLDTKLANSINFIHTKDRRA